ncbi:hypothetical protein LYSIN_00647 [Lysinibacillus sphaericus]|uniref:Uncharacterized protein n=1 Tax=Lysinibacillus sphaericus TaxID=1421 RepID=A0A2S5CYJ4_LYSSH|nr:hypothetical protein [Lysinibacillus sphaericus]POZ55864.1 hypothetical protein LYSIN_00647 [Lysinibacillus sphaericus]
MLKKKLSFILITLLLMISIIILPQNNAVAANLTLDEVSYIVTEYLKLDGISETVIIEKEQELKARIGEDYFNELVQTLEKINQVIASPEGKKLKEDIINQANSAVVMARISGCGAAALAAAAHTTAFTGLMTLAGVGGPVGWALGAAIGGVWLGASAAGGCLN